jgi:hypothetical protein
MGTTCLVRTSLRRSLWPAQRIPCTAATEAPVHANLYGASLLFLVQYRLSSPVCCNSSSCTANSSQWWGALISSPLSVQHPRTNRPCPVCKSPLPGCNPRINSTLAVSKRRNNNCCLRINSSQPVGHHNNSSPFPGCFPRSNHPQPVWCHTAERRVYPACFPLTTRCGFRKYKVSGSAWICIRVQWLS